jgi:hypothetical protein
MNRDQVTELHYITPIKNILSICRHGVLCHKLSQKHTHASVAMPEIQERRENKIVPGGKRLHEYANLYFHARNPMLFKRKDQHDQLCVLQIDQRVLDLPEVVITNQNAASGYARFFPSPKGLAQLDYDLVFAENWKHPDDFIREWQHKSIKCAEVLVPGQIATTYIQGGYVSNSTTKATLDQQLLAEGFHLQVSVNAYLFFQGGRL